jgi:hypothetical protein
MISSWSNLKLPRLICLADFSPTPHVAFIEIAPESWRRKHPSFFPIAGTAGAGVKAWYSPNGFSLSEAAEH